MRAAALLALAVASAACSATPTPRPLKRAEELERAGDEGATGRAYDEAAAALCDGKRGRARWCAGALRGAAEARARAGQTDEAAGLYERLPAQVPSLPEEGAAALTSAARLRLELGQDARAYDLAWRVIVELPETAAAEDALRLVVADGRRRDARQLYGVLNDLYARLGASAVGDNLLWDLAGLAHEELHDDRAALGACDRLVQGHPTSPLADDAAWQGAQLARATGDPEGAVRRLRVLLATRESSFLVGSYHSIHLDDAALLAARILRDDLHRPGDAAAELRRFLGDDKDSVSRDDALYELAVTLEGTGDRPGACRALATLHRTQPDSRYELELAPAARARLGCPDQARSTR